MKPKQFAIIGLGRFGASLALELMEQGYEVLGIDRNEEVVEDMSELLTHTVVADATDEEVLKSLGIRNFDCGIVAIGNDIQMSILSAILLKELGVAMVVAKAISVLHGRALEKLGVDRVIFPERDMGIRVAHQLVTPNLLDYIELSKDYLIVEMTVTDCMDGKTLSELNTRVRYGVSVVALNKQSGIIVAPTAMDVVNSGDIMVVIGSNDNVDRFESEVVNMLENKYSRKTDDCEISSVFRFIFLQLAEQDLRFFDPTAGRLAQLRGLTVDQRSRSPGFDECRNMNVDQPVIGQQLRPQIGFGQQRGRLAGRDQPDDRFEGVDLHPDIGHDAPAVKQIVRQLAVPGSGRKYDHREALKLFDAHILDFRQRM